MRKRLTTKEANKPRKEIVGRGLIALAKFDGKNRAIAKRVAKKKDQDTARRERALERAIERHAKTNTAALRRIRQARKKPSLLMAKMLTGMLANPNLNKEIKVEASSILLSYAKMGIDDE